MHRVRSVVPLLAALAFGSGGCSAPSEPAPSFAELSPSYFAALRMNEPAPRAALPDFERRAHRMAEELLAREARGELTSTREREDAGQALFYAGFLLHVGHHGIEDGYITASELLHPPQFSDGQSDQAELVARLRESERLLKKAAELRPADARVATVRRSVRYNLEALTGTLSPALEEEMLAATRGGLFDTFATIILWRDEALHPMNSSRMSRLFEIVCSEDHFDCKRMGPPPNPPAGEQPTLTTRVVGPAMVADLFVRRSEALLEKAEASPAEAPMALGEALGLLRGAQGTLSYALLSRSTRELRHFPFADALEQRVERTGTLLAAVEARQKGTPNPPAPPETRSYYAGSAYRALYQCVACHTAREGETGVPK